METVQIMDWVIYSQFLGKFKHLHDRDNTVSDTINRTFQREGIITEELIGKSIQLSERQKNDIKIYFTDTSKVLSHNQLDSNEELMSDDFVYHVGDIVFVDHKFEKIVGLITVNDTSFVDVEMFYSFCQDYESGIFFSRLNCQSYACPKMFRMEEVSPPLVTAVNNECILFVSFKNNNPLPWVDEHLEK